MTLHHQVLKVGHGNPGALQSQFFRQMQSPQHLNDFNVNELGCMKTLCRIQDARGNAIGSRRPQYQLNSSGRIQDDQRESRSARRTSVGDNLPV